MLVEDFKAILTNLDWQEYEDRVRGNSLLVTCDIVSSNDIITMKKQRYNNRPFKHKFVSE